MVLGVHSPLTEVGEDWLPGMPLIPVVLDSGDKDGERISSQFERWEDSLCTVGVSKSGQ